jgi:hypothetical protein
LKDIIQSFIQHVVAVAGAAPKLDPAPEAFERLPIYLGSLYEAWRGDLLEHHYLFLCFKGSQRPTPAQIAGHYRVVRRELNEPIAFVFTDLESFARRRLVQYRVPFVIPGHQMYLPLFLIDLREKTGGGSRAPSEPIAHLSGAAQALLLYYLQKPRASERCSLREWAALLGYTAMTATRIAGELAATQLCTVERKGRKTLLGLDHDRHALWEKALPLLRTPVRGSSYVRFAVKGKLPWLQAGIPALSHHTMLADDGHVVVAMSASEYARALVEGQVHEVPFRDEDAGTVERWQYRPEILSDGPTVDPLSLYLSLCDDPDERVQGTLKDLLEAIQW